MPPDAYPCPSAAETVRGSSCMGLVMLPWWACGRGAKKGLAHEDGGEGSPARRGQTGMPSVAVACVSCRSEARHWTLWGVLTPYGNVG